METPNVARSYPIKIIHYISDPCNHPLILGDGLNNRTKYVGDLGLKFHGPSIGIRPKKGYWDLDGRFYWDKQTGSHT